MAGKGTLTVRVIGDSTHFESTLGKLGKVGAVFGATVAAAGVGAAVGLFKIGESFDQEFDKIRVGTGATGDALKDLQGSFRNVLKTVPTDFDSAGTAIAGLNTRLGLTGKPLENLSGQMINLSRITGTELKGNVDNITRVFGDWGTAVEDQAGTMDKLFRAAQSSGIGIEDLSTSIVQFGAPLRNLGFGLDESMALLAQFNKTGVNTETVVAGLKIGVGTLAKAGEDVPSTFKRIVGEITKLGPGTEATGLAIQLFGQRAGPDLADAIAGGKFEIDAMLAAISDGEDTINGAAEDTADFSEKWQLFKNRVLVGLEPLARRVFDAMGTAMDKLAAWWEKNGPAITARVTEIKDAVVAFIEKALDRMKAWWDEHGPTVIAAVEMLRDVIVAVATRIIEVIGFVIENWDKFKLVVLTAIGIMIPHYVALGLAALASSVKQVAAWVATHVQAMASAVIHSVQVGIMVAKWVFLGAQALINAAKIAAAWLISMGPIGLIVIAIAGLVAAMILHWDKIKDVVLAGVRFVVDKFLALAETIVGAAAKAFGWVPGIGDKLKDAAAAVERFRDDVNRSLGGINDKTVTVGFRDVFGNPILGGGGGRSGGHGASGSFDDGGVVPGPRGMPQMVIAHGGETILPTHKSGGGFAGVHIEKMIINGPEDSAGAARAVVLALRMA